jgi:hypothetical protein
VDKAYDAQLETEVWASDAAKSGLAEPYRYECACCGEEVILAAVGSFRMVSHFRHKWENNGTDCENYLGAGQDLNTGNGSRRSKKDNVDFYFSNTTRLFYAGVKYTEQLINEHETNSSRLNISSGYSSKAFCSKPISRQYFVPDITEKIQLDEFAYEYYFWNSLDNRRRNFECFKKGKPTFFKLLGEDSASFYAKLVKSDVLYVGTRYLMLMVGQSQYSMPAGIGRLPTHISQEASFSFDTMRRKFDARIITITEDAPDIKLYLESWGYWLKTPEFILPLWPPMSVMDESIVANHNVVFVKTSFELQAHANINAHSKQFSTIGKLQEKVYKIEVQPSAKIHKENADILILCETAIESGFIPLAHKTEYCEKFECPKSGHYFAFGTSGVEYLSDGRRIILFAGSAIKGYFSNYPIIEFLPKPQVEQDYDELLMDILKNYKVEEVYNQNCTNAEPQSDVGKAYVTECLRCGRINVAVKRYISEGKL